MRKVIFNSYGNKVAEFEFDDSERVAIEKLLTIIFGKARNETLDGCINTDDEGIMMYNDEGITYKVVKNT
jgi:hypothetical protein